ncbi:hypothetical protein JXA88_12945 [Candidatus Fermentibacteria bacterium]|nr:hypothetical protein [Candidatus Fermentibacteria bacterium]
MVRIVITAVVLSLFFSSIALSRPRLGPPPEGFWGIHQTELEANRGRQPAFVPHVWPVAPLTKDRGPALSREVFGYYPYWVSGYASLRWDLLSTLAYFCVEANGDGSLGALHGWPVTGLINEAHLNGVRVVLTVTCFSSSTITSILSSPAHRTNLVSNLLTQVQAGGADGVNVDFEGMPAAQKDSLTLFMQELSTTFHAAIPGSHITIATPAVDWSGAFDYDELAYACDGLMVMGYDYFWSGSPTTGPVAPLDGYAYDVTWTVNDYLNYSGGQNDKIIVGCPYYGFDWPCTGSTPGSSTTGSGTAKTFQVAEPLAQTYGKQWHAPSSTPWYAYNSGSWHQCWYDDWASLEAKYGLFVSQDLQGAGIWALRYDSNRVELWDALDRFFGTVPRDLRLVNEGLGDLRVTWAAVKGAASYRVYGSTDGLSFDAGTAVADTTVLLEALPIGTVRYVRITSLVNGAESPPGEVLGARVSVMPAEVLLVHGFDRRSAGNTRDYLRQHAASLGSLGIAFDACSNEAVVDGRITLADYAAVDWILGNESTSDESFAWAEQALATAYLQSGGSLLISGSEIGYDLQAQGSATDQVFYHDYLKTDYAGDDAGVYQAQGAAGGIFAGVAAFGFDDGTHGTYDVAYPDRIAGYGGSTACLTYTGTAYDAGVQYSGTVPAGSAPCKIVSLGFPLETVYVATARDTLFSRVMSFFGIGPEPDVVPPEAVGDLAVMASSADLVLTWSAVTHDTLGSPENVARYVIYRVFTAHAGIGPADSVETTAATGWTDGGALPPAGLSAFYSVQVVDTSENRSALSARAGGVSVALP